MHTFEKSSANWQLVQVDSPGMSFSGSIVVLNEFPPTGFE